MPVTPTSENRTRFATSTYVRIDRQQGAGATGQNPPALSARRASASATAQSRRPAAPRAPPASSPANGSFFQPTREADRARRPRNTAAETNLKPPVRVAALESAAPQIAALTIGPPKPCRRRVPPTSRRRRASSISRRRLSLSRRHARIGPAVPECGRAGHRGHVNFRGHVFWESETYSDNRVLLHIPPGFDAKRPAVMVVYFHGHGADLARDVRDRQRCRRRSQRRESMRYWWRRSLPSMPPILAPESSGSPTDSSASSTKPHSQARARSMAIRAARRHSPTCRSSSSPIAAASGRRLSVLERGGVRVAHPRPGPARRALRRDRQVRRLDRRQQIDLLRELLHAAHGAPQCRSRAPAARAIGAVWFGAQAQSSSGHGLVPARRRRLASRFCDPCLGR